MTHDHPTDPADLSASEARRLIGVRQLSPVELLDACLARIRTVDGVLNAVVTIDEEGARATARAAEAAVMSGADLGPLHGLPVGFKDHFDTAGMRTTWGSPRFADTVPDRDEDLVANVRAAGGVVFAKTNLPEMSAGGNTTNPVFGATGHPWDPALTCGGSSGGSAVALATGMMPLAVGSDNAGSLRIPASFCGVVGMRPTAGVVPSSHRPAGLIPWMVAGPMARSVADCWLLLQALLPRTAADPLSGPIDPALRGPLRAADLGRLRVAASVDLGLSPIEPGLRATFQDRMARIAPMVHDIVWRDPDFDGLERTYDVIRAVQFLATYGARDATEPGFFGSLVTANLAKARQYTIEDAGWAFGHQTVIYRRFLDYMADVDVMICPTMAVYPWPKEQMFPTEINGSPMAGYFDWVALTYAITVTGHPCLSIPCGVDDRGLPFGLQLVGRRHGDADLLGVAHALELVFAPDPILRRPVPEMLPVAGA